MATIKELAKGRKDVYMLDPRDIQEDPGWNVRLASEELEAHIQELAISIAEIGVKTPIIVYMKEGIPTVVDGHCRLMAVKRLIADGIDIQSVPVEMEGRLTNDADRVLSILTRNLGLPLKMAEKAEVVKKLVAYGWEKSEIAKKAGLSMSGLENLFTLCAAPASVQTMVKEGEVSATMAVETVKEHGEKAEEVLKDAVKTAKKRGKKKATKKDTKPRISKETRYYCMGVVHALVEYMNGKSTEEILEDGGIDLSLAEDDEAKIIYTEYPKFKPEGAAE